jgi:hypothetical protein
MAAEWADDDDFYGAGCEMDDQMLILDDTNEDEIADGDDTYEREFLAKQTEHHLMSDESFNAEDYRSWQRLNKTSFSKSVNNNIINSSSSISQKNRKGEDDETIYPPDRRAPIFDFFTVLTAFIVAVILAYYTISSY